MTPRQKRFVEEYLKDPNATQAAVRAGYSEKTAAVIGSENLRKPKIAEAVKESQAKRAERVEITADMILAELWKNVEMARDLGKMTDSNRALELCDKHIGALTERLHVTSDKNTAVDELANLLGVSPQDVLSFHADDELVS